MHSVRWAGDTDTFRNVSGRRSVPGSSRGLVMLAGWTGTVDYWAEGENGITVTKGLADYERERGVLTASCAVDSTWGNATIRNRITALIDGNQTSGYWPTGKVHVFGNSMGSICAAKWALENPTKIASLGLSLFPPDIQTLYDRNALGSQSSLGAAYGGERPPDDENPMKRTDEFAAMGIPIKIWFSDNDTVTPLSETLAFGLAVGDAVTGVSMGSVGHTWGDFSVFNGAALADFIRSAP